MWTHRLCRVSTAGELGCWPRSNLRHSLALLSGQTPQSTSSCTDPPRVEMPTDDWSMRSAPATRCVQLHRESLFRRQASTALATRAAALRVECIAVRTLVVGESAVDVGGPDTAREDQDEEADEYKDIQHGSPRMPHPMRSNGRCRGVEERGRSTFLGESSSQRSACDPRRDNSIQRSTS